MSDNYWFDNAEVLFQKNRLSEFFPHDDMTMAEKMNAIVRFAIYFTVIMGIGRHSTQGVYLLLVVLGFTYVAGKRDKPLESPVADDPELQLQPTNPMLARKGQKTEAECVMPTKDNPFMNFDKINDWVSRPDRAPACNYKRARNAIKTEFEKGLYRDVDDLWDKNNSQSRFYTNPVTTICNDQELFAKALYGNFDGSCKENQYNCGGEWPMGDLRFNRWILQDPNRNPV